MTALENVAVPLEFAGVADAFDRAREGLKAVGLGERVTHYPGQLSGGEQQRVALARAFAAEPALLLADEPTGNLDAATGAAIVDLMFELRRKRDATLLLITHDGELAARCDRIMRMHDGRIAPGNAGAARVGSTAGAMSELALAFRLARRELRGGLKGWRVFLACLVLGVAAIAGVGSFAASITRALQEDARVLLGGDVELSFTHRAATQPQLDYIARGGQVSTVAEMRAMARTDAARTLVELKAVDGAYPLVGAIGLGGGLAASEALARRDGAWGAALEQATLNRLGLRIGDSFAVGDARFVVRAVVEREPDRTANVFTLGPRVMIALAALPDTGLLQPGSLVRYQYRIALDRPAAAEEWITALKAQFPDAGWRIRGLGEATPGVRRWIDRIAMFLTLVGLSALLVGGVGVANAVRAYLDGKTQTIAVLKCLGAPGRLVMLVYLLQVLALALLAVVIGVGIGALTPSVIGPLVADKLPVAARAGVYPAPLLIAAAFGILTTLAFTLWPVARAREVPAAALFRDLVAPMRRWPRPLAITATIAAVAALAALAIATSIDKKLGAGFVAGALATFALFYAAGGGVAWLAQRVSHVRRPGLRLALANMHRPGSPMPSVMLSLGLGLTVMVLIAEAQGNFVRTLREQIPAVAPSFFFIDIQPDQIGPFNDLLRGSAGVDHIEQVPALRGRIVRLAGVPVEQAPIAPDAQWAIGSDRGLTYSAVPPPGTRIVAGAVVAGRLSRAAAGVVRRADRARHGARRRRHDHHQRPRPRGGGENRQPAGDRLDHPRHQLHPGLRPRHARGGAAHLHRHRARSTGGRGRHRARDQRALRQRLDDPRQVGADRGGSDARFDRLGGARHRAHSPARRRPGPGGRPRGKPPPAHLRRRRPQGARRDAARGAVGFPDRVRPARRRRFGRSRAGRHAVRLDPAAPVHADRLPADGAPGAGHRGRRRRCRAGPGIGRHVAGAGPESRAGAAAWLRTPPDIHQAVIKSLGFSRTLPVSLRRLPIEVGCPCPI